MYYPLVQKTTIELECVAYKLKGVKIMQGRNLRTVYIQTVICSLKLPWITNFIVMFRNKECFK